MTECQVALSGLALQRGSNPQTTISQPLVGALDWEHWRFGVFGEFGGFGGGGGLEGLGGLKPWFLCKLETTSVPPPPLKAATQRTAFRISGRSNVELTSQSTTHLGELTLDQQAGDLSETEWGASRLYVYIPGYQIMIMLYIYIYMYMNTYMCIYIGQAYTVARIVVCIPLIHWHS